MKTLKTIVTCLLIAFIVFAIVNKIVSRNTPQEPIEIQGEFIVMLFHAEVRCQSCNTLESYVKEVLEKQEYLDSGIKLVLLEYDSPKNLELAKRFRIGTASVVLVEQKDGEIVRSYDFTPEAWHWIDYKNRFIETLETRLNTFFLEDTAVREAAGGK